MSNEVISYFCSICTFYFFAYRLVNKDDNKIAVELHRYQSTKQE